MGTKAILWIVFLSLLVLAGCSSGLKLEVSNDLFWQKKHEPRKEMPWYGGVFGGSNKNGGKVASQSFPKLGEQ